MNSEEEVKSFLKAIADEEEKTESITTTRFELLLQIESKIRENSELDDEIRKLEEEMKMMTPPQTTATRFFIGNVGPHINETMLKSYFSNYGEIDEICTVQKRISYAFIAFSKIFNWESFQKQRHVIKGRLLSVQTVRNPPNEKRRMPLKAAGTRTTFPKPLQEVEKKD